MTQFLVIPRDTPGQFDHLSPDEMQQLIGRYGAWSQSLAEKGQMVLGHKLVDGVGRVARIARGEQTSAPALPVADRPRRWTPWGALDKLGPHDAANQEARRETEGVERRLPIVYGAEPVDFDRFTEPGEETVSHLEY